jgi:SAM-dependent methyltransferase
MSDSTQRFSSKVADYVKYRPGYPEAVIKLLETECGLGRDSLIADVGSGTGILSELFLLRGYTVFGIEPNEAMRAAADNLLQDYKKFHSTDGTAEATKLTPHSVDLVTAAQAFHWFDQRRAAAEFVRILKPQGWAALIWNERRLDSTPFLGAYEDLLLEFGTDYTQVRHENVYDRIADFFAPQEFQLVTFENLQPVDFDGLRGRLLSSSYIPTAADPRYRSMLERLRELFLAHQKDDMVMVEYDTKVYFGHLTR